MASPQKLKILCVMQILLDYSDEDHVLSATRIVELLERDYDIIADRKGIYNDVEILREFDMDIEQKKGTNPGYYVASREFELAELKLLVDAVQSSKFISTKKSKQLIGKLEKLTNQFGKKQLQRQVYISNRAKTDNENILINVDNIHSAINNNRTILFKYVNWTVDGNFEERRGGALYEVSPWALTWDDENYYLVAYDSHEEKIKHFRVDKMRKIEVSNSLREGKEHFENFDLGVFARKTFGMFDGKEEHVTLVCDNSLCGVIFDRFGKDGASVRNEDDENIRVSVNVCVSPQFFGWMTGLGEKIKIVAPESVKNNYEKYIKLILENYK